MCKPKMAPKQSGVNLTALGNWGGAQVQVPQLQVKSQAIFLDTT